MYIKTIRVLNYRRFIDETLDFEKDVTFIAGPNNSGKTSLTTIIKDIIMDRKSNHRFTDLPISAQKLFFDSFYVELSKLKNDFENEKEEFEKIITSLLKSIATQIRINIGYNKNDDIKLFTQFYMDLEKDIMDFYFLYIYQISTSQFMLSFFENKDKYVNDVDLNDKKSIDKNKRELIKLIDLCTEAKIFYCDSEYEIMNPIERKSDFLSLFNVMSIQANRPLDDIDDDKNYGLSSTMISILKKTDDWDTDKDDLIKSFEEALVNIREKVQALSDNALIEPLKQVEKTSGKEKTEVTLSLITRPEELERFIIGIMEAVYNINGVQLGENSQGLGYSNLIFIHLLLQDYINTIDLKKVNLFIIEEPESHMHPQMQRIFITHFIKEIKDRCQGLISTHSTEVVRIAQMHRIRVIRKDDAKSYIKSLKVLVDVKEGDSDDKINLSNFFNYFFDIAFSEIIFADKAIFYEGDTERLYIQNIIKYDSELEDLKNQYISFIQVGGAYAHEYHELIKLLNIPSLVITDIDYEKSEIDISKIGESDTTNAALKWFYKYTQKEEDYRCIKLYEWNSRKLNVIDDIIYVSYQTENDGYSRTLEEAMFCRKMGVNIDYVADKDKWKEIKEKYKWDFSLPREKEKNVSIRDIIKSTTNRKTDFMYSIVLSKNVLETEPHYIKEGLKWLIK